MIRAAAHVFESLSGSDCGRGKIFAGERWRPMEIPIEDKNRASSTPI
jgi:hypothetical protein